MQFFKQYFKLEGISPSHQGEYSVLCPFSHKDQSGNTYKETNASAHVNEDKSIFHCKSCGEGISEAAFVSRIEGLYYKDAIAFIHTLEGAEKSDWQLKVDNLKSNLTLLQELKEMGIDSQVDSLQLGFSGAGIDFPVHVYGQLLDVRNYKPDRKPKVLSRTGAKNLIVPFDLWREDDSPTVLCAGEKDMAIARAMGFNAITFTGGENSFPKLFKHSFKGRHVFIVYDNDQAGEDGAAKAAFELAQVGAIVRIVTGHHLVCTEKGGDVHDFFMKYGKTAAEFSEILNRTSEVEPKQIEKIRNVVNPLIRLGKAAGGAYANKRYVRSVVSVVSIFEDQYNVPDYVRMTKTHATEKCYMELGDTSEWVLDDTNAEDLLMLCDSGITKAKRDAQLRRLCRVDKDEKFMRIEILSSIDVFKAVVSDVLSTSTVDVKASELLIYSMGDNLGAGKKYDLLYKPVSHPLDNMKMVGIAKEAEDIDSDVQNFEVTPAIRESLQVFQVADGETVFEKMDEQAERAKGFIGVEARKEVTWATDMYYNTPLEFKIGKRVERAYLDAMIIGDPRTMKSATAKAMQAMYELGTITSLKTATITGLIGGSDASGGSGWKTRIGLLPQSHRGAVIMEEFSGGGREAISKLTEIRSSNRVRITRVSGTIDVPAMVRMLSISNPATSGGISHSLKSYPTGVQVILDLVGASEDIARYDFFLLVDEPEGYISPLDMFDLDPYDKQSYMDRIRWIWSRSKEQVELERPVAQYIVDESIKLNALYDSQIKLFGAEAWKKVSRIAIAVAGMVVSTDEKFERIVVKNEHVDFAVKFLKDIYDNKVFSLREYVENERSYSICRTEDVHTLQEIYTNHSGMLEQIAISTEVTQRQLQLVSGLEPKEFGAIVATLTGSKFIMWRGEKLAPTAKFRLAMPQMNSQYMKRASEQ